MKHRHSFWYRIWFTKNDDLDLTQCYFAVIILFFIVAFALTGAGVWEVSTAMWATFGGIFGTLAITGTPRWVAEILAKSKIPGELARGIAGAGEVTTSTDVSELWAKSQAEKNEIG